MTATQDARKPFELMDHAEQLIAQSILITTSKPVAGASINYNLRKAQTLVAQASAMVALAQARMIGQGRA